MKKSILPNRIRPLALTGLSIAARNPSVALLFKDIKLPAYNQKHFFAEQLKEASLNEVFDDFESRNNK